MNEGPSRFHDAVQLSKTIDYEADVRFSDWQKCETITNGK